jgi:ribonuclease BN (tRNA processing enzyme)
VEIQAGAHTLIFDAGSGIIRLGEHLMREQSSKGADGGDAETEIDLFITHAHSDHLQGFPFFAPLFDARTQLNLFGPQLANQSIEQLVTTLMSPPYFPVDVRQLPSKRCYHTITDETCVIWQAAGGEPVLIENLSDTLSHCTSEDRGQDDPKDTIRVAARLTHSHPQNGALIYRIEYAGRRIVYATDVEWRNGLDPDFVHFCQGADLLIHDAQYTARDYQQEKQGFGHSTVEMATEVAQAAQVRHLVLFHHEPTYDDEQLERMEAHAQTIFAHTQSAQEGMEIELL